MLSGLVGLLVLSSFCFSTSSTTTPPPNTNDTQGNPWVAHRPFIPGDIRSGNMSFPTMQPYQESTMCDMLLNSLTPLPMDQVPFECICSHCKGKVGPKGDRGDRGLPGQPGSPGLRGRTGFPGRPGFRGLPGIKGQKGDEGEKGQEGPSGFAGAKGARGFKGEKGDLGTMGPAGTPGPQGEKGECPNYCENVQGIPGPQGPVGPAGTRGLPGINGEPGPKGFKGNKGDPGIHGVPGSEGLKGDKGDKGICDCVDGKDGAVGPKGQKGEPGLAGGDGVAGIDGPDGPPGADGPMGPPGPPGPCTPAIQSAFSACLEVRFPVIHWPVPFPRVLTNAQAHFNPYLGMYTAPVNGTYIFSFHLSVAMKSLKVGLFLNYFPVVKMTEVNSYATASQTTIMHLTKGDQLWLQVKSEETNGMYVDEESSSCFSGYLLYPDSCQYTPNGRDAITIPAPLGDFQWDPTNSTAPPPVSHNG